ncbi:MAG: NAD-dependent epimerase/dehydratase family protein, partial [Nannocystaceae bacterium]
RYANVYGPRQNPKAEGGVVAIFASRLVRNSELAVFGRAQLGDGGGIRDYVYIRDVVQANLAAHRGQLQGQTLDISTGIGTTTSELAETLKSIVGGQSSIVSRPPREGDLQRSVVDPQPMIDQLGKPTTLRAGLTETVEWFALRTKREG